MQLLNNVLRFISDDAARITLAKQFPFEGRQLLRHLRFQKDKSISTTLASIDALMANGLQEATAEAFQRLLQNYNQLLALIPDAHPLKDTPAQQAHKLTATIARNNPDSARMLLLYMS